MAETFRNPFKLLAAGIKLAAYTTRRPGIDEWDEMQYHLTYNNTIYGALSEHALVDLQTFLREGDNFFGRNVQINAFDEEHEDGSVVMIHVYEFGQLRARMGADMAQLFTTALDKTNGN